MLTFIPRPASWLLICSVVCVQINAESWLCTEDTLSDCQAQTFYCYDPPCDLRCIGESSCSQSTLNCPLEATAECQLTCEGSHACYQFTFNGGHGTAVVECHGFVACKGSNLNAESGAKLFVNATGDHPFVFAKIYCPSESEEFPGAECVITYANSYHTYDPTVYASDPNLQLVCTDEDGCRIDLVCGDALQHSCTAETIWWSLNDWACADSSEDRACDGLILNSTYPPTQAPMHVPSDDPTAHPTTVPTTTHPSERSTSNPTLDLTANDGDLVSTTSDIGQAVETTEPQRDLQDSATTFAIVLIVGGACLCCVLIVGAICRHCKSRKNVSSDSASRDEELDDEKTPAILSDTIPPRSELTEVGPMNISISAERADSLDDVNNNINENGEPGAQDSDDQSDELYGSGRSRTTRGTHDSRADKYISVRKQSDCTSGLFD